MTKINPKKVAGIFESQGMVSMVIFDNGFYSVRCGGSCDNTKTTLRGAIAEAKSMLKDEVHAASIRREAVERLRVAVDQI